MESGGGGGGGGGGVGVETEGDRGVSLFVSRSDNIALPIALHLSAGQL